MGIFNVKSAKVVGKREIPLEVASAFTDVPRYVAKYGQAKVYYVAVDYTVFQEIKYYMNGINYRLAKRRFARSQRPMVMGEGVF